MKFLHVILSLGPKMEIKCPGAATVKRPELVMVPCPKCGLENEMFTDEAKTTCEGCGEAVFREKKPSCFDWCQHAAKCLEAIEGQGRGL